MVVLLSRADVCVLTSVLELLLSQGVEWKIRARKLVNKVDLPIKICQSGKIKQILIFH